MEDHKIFAGFGLVTTLQVMERFFVSAEPFFQALFLTLQIVISALTATLLYKKLRKKK